jgi:hypothetical protein
MFATNADSHVTEMKLAVPRRHEHVARHLGPQLIIEPLRRRSVDENFDQSSGIGP